MTSWQPNVDHSIYHLDITDTSDAIIKTSVEASALKIIGLLDNIILDDSLYLIFEWDQENAVLSASVTDANKTNDASKHIKCNFSGLNKKFAALDPDLRAQQQISTTENIKFVLQDYLASCTEFFQFSLVAIFHTGSRANTELL